MTMTNNNRCKPKKLHNKDELVTRVEQIRMKAKDRQTQPELDLESSTGPAETAPVQEAAAIAAIDSAANEKRDRERSKLLPVRHLNRDFFLCDLFDYALKDDSASMEAPIFSLATKPDKDEWQWQSKDGTRFLQVIPSVRGRATQMDKDVLIYVISQLTEGLNIERQDAEKRRVRFTVYNYLLSTNKPTGGNQYERLEVALDRLSGTRIKTNIQTGGTRIKQNFGVIEGYKIVEKSLDDERMIAIEVELSEWLFNAVKGREILTISPDYFRLRKPLERRLYELARKHCGHQTMWAIGLALLQEKAGSKGSSREFRRMVREIIVADTLPDYRMSLDNADKVTFYTKDSQRLLAGLTKQSKKI